MADRGQSLAPYRGGGTDIGSLWDEADVDFFGSSSVFGASPWQVLRRMQEDMDRTFGRLLMPFQAAGQQVQGQHSWSPRVDICRDDREYTIDVELPGVSKDNINVEVQNQELRIRAEMRQETPEAGGQTSGVPNISAQQSGTQQQSGSQQQSRGQQSQQGDGSQRQYMRRERRYGYFERTLPLPEDVDDQAIRCEFRNGVLTCRLPRKEQAQQQGRRVQIEEPGAQTSQIPPAQQKKAA